MLLIPGLLPIFLHGCEIKSGSGIGTRIPEYSCESGESFSHLSDVKGKIVVVRGWGGGGGGGGGGEEVIWSELADSYRVVFR